MTLVPPGLRISAVLFDGFELLDAFGPLEMFSLMGPDVQITLLGSSAGPVASSAAAKAFCDSAIVEASPPDILLVPGGIGTRRLVNDEIFLAELRRLAEGAQIVASVCTGAGLLASAGLLDGKRATSNKLCWEWAVSRSHRVHWVRRARWVVDGRLWTSSGISAGIDMSLAIIHKLRGSEVVENVARQAEYIWNADPDRDPFADYPASHPH